MKTEARGVGPSRRPGLPCIAASGLTTLQDQMGIDELKAFGVTSFLSKPFSAEALLEMVRRELL